MTLSAVTTDYKSHLVHFFYGYKSDLVLSTSNLCRDTASESVQKDSSGERHDQENAHSVLCTMNSSSPKIMPT